MYICTAEILNTSHLTPFSKKLFKIVNYLNFHSVEINSFEQKFGTFKRLIAHLFCFMCF